jgi:deazaflavin-dependent oxidoreductase (nitroreductase family)
MTNYQGSEELLARKRDFVQEHRDLYLSSRGCEGHIVDMRDVGALGPTPTLLLRTIGRKSGKPLVVPLIYGFYGGEWIIIGSKGGSPNPPAWYLNLQANPEVAFQVATQAFQGIAREAQGEERARLWDFMTRLFPPYELYQKAAEDRVIPVVTLRTTGNAPLFEA